MATDLYHRMLAFDYGDAERSDLQRKVWENTPWMVDAYTGGYSKGRDREFEMLNWCHDQFGQQARPIHGMPGRWHRGGATINGWTWMGFSTEDEMKQFVEQWPAPKGVEPGQYPPDAEKAA